MAKVIHVQKRSGCVLERLNPNGHPISKIAAMMRSSQCMLFSYDSSYDTTFTSVVTELTEIDTLPCAEIQTTFCDGNADAHATECALCVCRHVIRAFKDVVIVWLVLLYETIENLFHIRANIRIGILIDAQSATGVLHKEV